MSDRFEFWIHGVNTVIGWPGFLVKPKGDPDSSVNLEKEEIGKEFFKIKRDQRGTLIQRINGQNGYALICCYIALPTATWLDDDKTEHRHAYLTASCDINRGNKQPKIEQIWVYHGPDSEIYHKRSPYTELEGYDANTTLAPRKQNHKFDLPNNRCTNPLVIKTEISFYHQNESIWIQGAGAWIEERY